MKKELKHLEKNDLINQKFDLVKKTKLIKIRTVVSFYGGGCFYNCNLITLNGNKFLPGIWYVFFTFSFFVYQTKPEKLAFY